MSAGWVGHFPETGDPDLQLQVQVPPELEQADSWMTPLPENERNILVNLTFVFRLKVYKLSAIQMSE
jgi:hypothetical protein